MPVLARVVLNCMPLWCSVRLGSLLCVTCVSWLPTTTVFAMGGMCACVQTRSTPSCTTAVMPVCVSSCVLVPRAMIALILWNPLVLACLFLSFHLVLPAVPAVQSPTGQSCSPSLEWNLGRLPDTGRRRLYILQETWSSLATGFLHPYCLPAFGYRTQKRFSALPLRDSV